MSIDDVQVEKAESVTADAPVLGVEEVHIAISSDRMIAVGFCGSCLMCDNHHHARTGFMLVPTEMVPSMIEQLRECLKRITS